MSPRFVDPPTHSNRPRLVDPGAVAVFAALVALALIVVLIAFLELGCHTRVADLLGPLLRRMQITIFTN